MALGSSYNLAVSEECGKRRLCLCGPKDFGITGL
jgi:hypothetical protein